MTRWRRSLYHIPYLCSATQSSGQLTSMFIVLNKIHCFMYTIVTYHNRCTRIIRYIIIVQTKAIAKWNKAPEEHQIKKRANERTQSNGKLGKYIHIFTRRTIFLSYGMTYVLCAMVCTSNKKNDINRIRANCLKRKWRKKIIMYVCAIYCLSLFMRKTNSKRKPTNIPTTATTTPPNERTNVTFNAMRKLCLKHNYLLLLLIAHTFKSSLNRYGIPTQIEWTHIRKVFF